jgi:mono/diheme cytochrome c family protein
MRPKCLARAVVLVAMLVTGACAPETQSADPDPARGRTVAGEWCASCHGATGRAPGFAEIAMRPGRDHMYLTNFMADLHLPMPTYRLWPEERAAVVAYIQSLKGS